MTTGLDTPILVSRQVLQTSPCFLPAHALSNTTRKRRCPMSSALNAPETGWSRRVLPLIARFGARLSFTIILYVFLEKFLDPRLILVELVVELAIAMRAGIGSTAGSLGPIYSMRFVCKGCSCSCCWW